MNILATIGFVLGAGVMATDHNLPNIIVCLPEKVAIDDFQQQSTGSGIRPCFYSIKCIRIFSYQSAIRFPSAAASSVSFSLIPFSSVRRISAPFGSIFASFFLFSLLSHSFSAKKEPLACASSSREIRFRLVACVNYWGRGAMTLTPHCFLHSFRVNQVSFMLSRQPYLRQRI